MDSSAAAPPRRTARTRPAESPADAQSGGARSADASPGNTAPTPPEPAGASGLPADPDLMTVPVRALLRREAVMLPPTATIRQAALLMKEQRVSCVMLLEREHLFGLVTDRDLRNRVVAQGLDTARPVHEIATLAPLTVGIDSLAFDALLLMARHNVHHVPVMDGQQVAGMITATDLAEQHNTSAVNLVGEIHRQDSVAGLVKAGARIRRLQQNLAAAGATAYATGHIVTAVADAITSRLLQLGAARLGPAPVEFAWVAAGSQARNEQTARSDQDNCMVLDDRYDEARHGAYFDALARFVCDGLAACGYEHCPGEMMAMTPRWRQPLARWREYFRGWTTEPDPTALMLSCVFFDMRLVDGQAELFAALRRDVLRQTQDNRLFLSNLVGLALAHQPALNVFGKLAPIRSGEHRRTIDLKHTGVVPIVDLARVYALAGGLEAVNTHDRLLRAAESGEIAEHNARDLRHALEFLAGLRIRHQARQLDAGRSADNFVAVDALSNFERSQLRDAFVVVQTVQKALAQRYRK